MYPKYHKFSNRSDFTDMLEMLKKIVWLFYCKHNFSNMLLFQEQGLCITDFF